MVCDGGKIKLEHLVLKPIRYQHHHLNFKESLENGLIPKGLKINKQPAIKPVKEEFFEKQNAILLDTEKTSVQLLLRESLQVVKKLDEKIVSEIKKVLMMSEKNEFSSKISTRTIRRNYSSAKFVNGKS